MNILTTFAAKLSASQVNIPTLAADDVLVNTLHVVYYIAGIMAVIVIVLAGFTYVLSGDNPSNVTKARNAILYAVIGLGVIMLAFVITQFVAGRI